LRRTFVMNPVSDLGAAGFVLFWGLTALAAAIFFFRGYQLLRYLRLGRKVEEFPQMVKRALAAIGHLIIQECQFKNINRKDRAGLGHLFMVWGFLLFVIYYFFFIVIASGFGISDAMEHNVVYGVYCWVMDIVAPFIVIGALWGIIRRYILKPSRLQGQRTFEAMLILVTVLIHPVTHVGKIATQIAAGHPPAGLGIATPPISTVMSNIYTNTASIEMWHNVWFWSHWAFVLLVLAIIGYTRYLHMIAAIFNDLLRSEPPKGIPSPINLKDQATLGVSRVDGFTRKQLLDVYACVVCGRCQEVCPATFTDDKPLNPRLIIRDIKTNLLENGPLLLKKKEPKLALIGDGQEGSVSEDALWACTICGACMEVCPMFVEHVPKIIDMRRYLVKNGLAPENLTKLITTIGETHNMGGKPNEQRANWVSRLKLPYDLREKKTAEVVYFVGCVSSFFPMTQPTARAFAQLMEAAGLDFGIVSGDEWCCGFPLMVAGETEGAVSLIKHNVERMKDAGAKTVVMTCPGCYRVWKGEYEELTGERQSFEVLHATEMLARLIEEGRLSPKGFEEKVTYHDPCDLGRNSGIFDEPRYIMGKIPGLHLVELEENREHCTCCGSGGDLLASNQELSLSIARNKVEKIKATGAQTVVTACPSCIRAIHMAKTQEKVRLNVMDITELLWKAMENRKTTEE
jgi:Fe-S oxidoreductase